MLRRDPPVSARPVEEWGPVSQPRDGPPEVGAAPWHLEGRFCLTRRVVGALLLVMALHDVVDGVALFGRAAGLGVWLVLTAAIYVAFRYVVRAAVPPDSVDLVPPRWRPTPGPLGL